MKSRTLHNNKGAFGIICLIVAVVAVGATGYGTYKALQGPAVPPYHYPYVRTAGNLEWTGVYNSLAFPYPQYPGYYGCGQIQPEDVPQMFTDALISWEPRCHWKKLSALPGYEDEECVLRIRLDAVGVAYRTVLAPAHYEDT